MRVQGLLHGDAQPWWQAFLALTDLRVHGATVGRVGMKRGALSSRVENVPTSCPGHIFASEIRISCVISWSSASEDLPRVGA